MPARVGVEVENEIDILSQIWSLRLVNLVGFNPATAAGDNQDRLLVVEFMKNGTLYDVLHFAPNPPPGFAGSASRYRRLRPCSPFTPPSPIVHRDIKSTNVLIDRHYNARLGDLALAHRCSGGAAPSTPPAGTLGYLNPCYLTPASLSTMTDVFSFGILLLEIISGSDANGRGGSG